MSQRTTNASSILRPEDVHELLIEPVQRESVAFAASTPVTTSAPEVRFPKLTADPTAGWVAEGEEITVDDAEFGDITVKPAKVAAITAVSVELAADSSPEASKVIGQALVRSLTAKIDQAWFAATTVNGPSGLKSLTGAQLVLAGSAPTNTDAFLEAITAAENVGGTITSWVMTPETALLFSRLKKQVGNEEPLLATDAASADGRKLRIAGVPVITTPYVSPVASPAPTIWGICRDRTYAVMRSDVVVDADKSVYWSSDRLGLKATARVGFGFPHEPSVIEVRLADA